MNEKDTIIEVTIKLPEELLSKIITQIQLYRENYNTDPNTLILAEYYYNILEPYIKFFKGKLTNFKIFSMQIISTKKDVVEVY